MSLLLCSNGSDKVAEVILDPISGMDGKHPPLTIGTAPESESHIHLDDDTLAPHQSRLLGAGSSRAYAFVLAGRRVRVNERLLEGIRVLRHGDVISLGASKLLFLDFGVQKLKPGSRLLNKRCSLHRCPDLLTLEEFNNEVILCPWCASPYYARCWLGMERCATRDCYPIRRMLLAEIGGHLRFAKAGAAEGVQLHCAARCEDPQINNPNKTITVCPNVNCGAAYHLGCLLSLRAPCLECGDEATSIPALLDRFVFKADWKKSW